MIAGLEKTARKWDEEEVTNAAILMLQSDLSPSQAARQLAEQSGWPRRKIYKILTDLQNAGS